MNKARTTSFRLLVEGPAACFRRPEFTEDFVSYDVMPPFVATRMLNALYHPADSRWVIRYIHVLKPIKFRLDHIAGARRQRRALVLEDVAYVIEADLAEASGCATEHRQFIDDAIAAGATIHLGLGDYPASIRLIDEHAFSKKSFEPVMHDLGWMLYDIRSPETKLPTFFRAQLRNGRIDLTETLTLAL